MALTAAERNAITKAFARGGARAVVRRRHGVYAVRSAVRPGVAYTVTVVAGVYRCTCAAGQHERVCWHQAAAWLAELEHTSRVRVTGPGTRAPIDEAGAPRRAGAA